MSGEAPAPYYTGKATHPAAVAALRCAATLRAVVRQHLVGETARAGLVPSERELDIGVRLVLTYGEGCSRGAVHDEWSAWRVRPGLRTFSARSAARSRSWSGPWRDVIVATARGLALEIKRVQRLQHGTVPAGRSPEDAYAAAERALVERALGGVPR